MDDFLLMPGSGMSLEISFSFGALTGFTALTAPESLPALSSKGLSLLTAEVSPAGLVEKDMVVSFGGVVGDGVTAVLPDMAVSGLISGVLTGVETGGFTGRNLRSKGFPEVWLHTGMVNARRMVIPRMCFMSAKVARFTFRVTMHKLRRKLK